MCIEGISVMRRVLLILLCSFVSSIYASEVTLKCVTDTGQKAADLKIDLALETMKWAHIEYKIHHSNDMYISAYEKNVEIGGEVWVINRVTGEYKRSAVGMYCNSDCGKNDTQVLLSRTYAGRCTKQQF
jgi:hypothetical protein